MKLWMAEFLLNIDTDIDEMFCLVSPLRLDTSVKPSWDASSSEFNSISLEVEELES